MVAKEGHMTFDPKSLICVFHYGFPSAYILYGVKGKGKGKIVQLDAKMLKMGV